MTAPARAQLALLLLLAACAGDDEKAIFVPNTDTDRPTDRDTSEGSADASEDTSVDSTDTDLVDTTPTDTGADTDLVDTTATDTDLTDTAVDTTPDTVADTTPTDTSDTTDTRPDPTVVWTPEDSPAPPAGAPMKTFSCPRRDPASTFYITEVQINPNNGEGRGTSTEWFEVINMGAAPLNLNGVRVADADFDTFTIGEAPPANPAGTEAVCADLPEVGAFYENPSDTTISQYEFFTFYQQTQIDPACAADPLCKPYQGLHYFVFDRCYMAIGNSGDEIILYDTRGRVLDCIEYANGDDVEARSIQRQFQGGNWTDDWCVTEPLESLRYNSNATAATPPVPGDYGTPGRPPRCWE